MSDDVFVKARRNPTLTGEGITQALFANRAGALVRVSLIDQLIAAGYGYHVTVGALTTPIVGGGNGTVFDPEQSELSISVPSGVAIYPIRLSVQAEVPADQDADVQEILIAADRAAASTATSSTGTVETAFNLRTDNPRTSNLTVVSANTSDHATPTLGLELARKQMVTNILTSGITQGFLDLLYEPENPPLLVGPCAVYFYWGGTQAMSAFAQAQWVEMPESLNALWGGS